MSVSILIFFLQIRTLPAKVVFAVEYIAPTTFGIYLIHPLWVLALEKAAITGTLWHPVVGIPATSISVFILSLLSSALLAKMPFLRRVV